MNAPDKIYLVQNTPNTNFIWDVEEWGDHLNIEYIRKDSLLEWAEGKIKHYMDRQEYDCGWNDMLEELIEKLNSFNP